MKEKNDKWQRRQQRLTYLDTIDRQDFLLNLIEIKIKHNTALTDVERKDWSRLIGDTMLSQGCIFQCYYDYKNLKIPLGNAHTFALHMKNIQGPQHILTYKNHKIKVNIKELWSILHVTLEDIIPFAIRESINIAGEKPHREISDGYGFSSEGNINGS